MMSLLNLNLLLRLSLPLVGLSAVALAVQFGPQGSPPPFDDHAEMMKQLGIKSIRPGPDPRSQDTFSEENANRYASSLPDVLRFNNGKRVKTVADWWQRRTEIEKLFAKNVYGKIPKNAPKVSWEVTGLTPGMSGEIPTITKTLVGHVDNRAYPRVKVNIQASFTVPAHSIARVPIMIEFGFRNGVAFGPTSHAEPWTQQAIEHGWGYGTIEPNSIQPDNDHLELGFIGLCNKGKPRKPDDWGALRAWAWGLSKLIDYFGAHPNSMVDARKVGIEGVSRYGKAAIVAEAFDPRIAVGFIGSSGEGGTKLYRHIFGEAVENLAGGEFYWMAGSFMRYGSSDPPMTTADIPVDSHELIAMCAPRPCFLSAGIIAKGDPQWIDARGSYMAGILASPVYELFAEHGFGSASHYMTEPMPPVNQLVGGQLAWRQHDGGHEVTPNWPTFFDWISRYIAAPPLPANRSPIPSRSDVPTARTDANSLLAHSQLVRKAAEGGIDLYFEGDSITRRWGAAEPGAKDFLKNWRENFYGWNAANFGWGADATQNILWRIKNGELDGVNPKVIVLLAGTNNIGAGENAREVVAGVKAILKELQRKSPGATIILMGIFPRNDNLSFLPVIDDVNKRLSSLADGKRVIYLDINSKLADANGIQFPGLSVDKIHPTVKGYQAWADALKPILLRLLGPRATNDHAPAPTGDPSQMPKAFE